MSRVERVQGGGRSRRVKQTNNTKTFHSTFQKRLFAQACRLQPNSLMWDETSRGDGTVFWRLENVMCARPEFPPSLRISPHTWPRLSTNKTETRTVLPRRCSTIESERTKNSFVHSSSVRVTSGKPEALLAPRTKRGWPQRCSTSLFTTKSRSLLFCCSRQEK